MDGLNNELSYVPPDNQVNFLKEKVVDALEKILDKDVELGKEIQKKNSANAKVERFIIPLAVRDYAVIIEGRFPEIMKGTVTVPANVLKDTKPYDKYLVERKYKWNKILQENKNDDYVKLIIEELDKNFKMENKLEEIDKNLEDYKNYRLEFCNSVVNAIDQTNKMISHIDTYGAGQVKYDIIFDNVVDKYMVLFYKALLVKPDCETPSSEK